MFKKTIVIILSFIMLCLPVFAAYENTHTNTGNAMEDIIAIAETQLGYMEGSLEGTVQGYNDVTKYGEWYGLNGYPWCAMFVSWCADQADIPTTIIPRHSSCDEGMMWFIRNGRFSYGSAYGGTRTPGRGDIVYFGKKYGEGFDSTHVGIVYKVDSQKIHVLEGNSAYKVQTVSYNMSSDYVLGYGIPDYTLQSSERKAGTYVTTASSLNFRAGPTTSSASIGMFSSGTVLEITEVSAGKWGKTTYNGKTGWVSLDYCAACCSVTYNANGGTGAPKPQAKLSYSVLTLTMDIPERDGYTFAGWSTSPSGKVEYASGSKYDKDKSITLYAVWNSSAYTIRYNANGGSSAPKDQSKKHGEDIILSTGVPTREKFIFKGWSTLPDGKVEYQSGGKYTLDKSVTLYAVWELVKTRYTVTYDANGGTSAPVAGSFIEGEGMILSTALPVREGYVFEGWADTKNARWAHLFPGDRYDTNSSCTLYAVWSVSVQGLTVNVGKGGRVQRHVSGGTLTLLIQADKGNSISHILVDSSPVGLVGDLTEKEIALDLSPHQITVEFTKNDGIWINPFSDVPANAWYYGAVEYCYRNNIMTGVDELHFAPHSLVTRAQFVTLLGRLHGVKNVSGSTPFTDISTKSYYYSYLVWAYNNKLISGTSLNMFAPNSPITREQLCVILCNYDKYIGNKSDTGDTLLYDFSDNDKISSWARDAVAWAVFNGYISGSDGKLLPRDNATRAQAAQIIMKHSS